MTTDKKKIAELMKKDLYALLGVTSDASEKEIRSAYRKKALTCHPDKIRDNPEAAELFQQLTDALLILAESVTRATYDKLLKAKEHKAARDRERDVKRRKLIDELEARERSSRGAKTAEVDLEKQLQQEFARLREEGARILEEESRRMSEQLAASVSRVQEQLDEENSSTRLKIRWNPRERAYTPEDLERFLEKHGRISALVISKSKSGKAMVEFEDRRAAQSAVRYVKGYSDSPLTVSWVDEPKASHPQGPPAPTLPAQNSQGLPARSDQDDLDFEQMVFAKMRAKAAEQRAQDAARQDSQPAN